LLSEKAEADNKPELEIFADDVQCGHGATAGRLDENLLFYLKARGIPAKEAEALLIQAFVGEAIDGIGHEGVRDLFSGRVAAWLGARGRRLRRPPTEPTPPRAPAPPPPRWPGRSTASRWSIPTTPPRRRSRRPCSTGSTSPTRANTPTCTAGCTPSPMPP